MEIEWADALVPPTPTFGIRSLGVGGARFMSRMVEDFLGIHYSNGPLGFQSVF